MGSGPISASDLMDKLKNDEQYQQMIKEKEAARLKKQQELAKEEQQLVADINGAGYKVESVWDLVNGQEKYPDAIPILLAHLHKPYSQRINEGIIRSLGVKWLKAPQAIEQLFDLFEQEEDEERRWVIGNTLSIIVKRKEHVEQALTLLQNRKYGQSRDQLIHCVARYYRQDAIQPLLELIDDTSLTPELLSALGKLKAQEAKPYIEPFIHHEDSWVRKHAKAALKKIG